MHLNLKIAQRRLLSAHKDREGDGDRQRDELDPEVIEKKPLEYLGVDLQGCLSLPDPKRVIYLYPRRLRRESYCRAGPWTISGVLTS